MAGQRYVKVIAAIIRKERRILIGKRKGGTFAGKWEFPGGKMELGETPEECLARELAEELGVEARIGKLFLSTRHTYSHMAIEFVTYETEIISGEPCLRDHHEIRWVLPEELTLYDFPEADWPVVEKLMGRE
ncbi:MAG TPA: (deoxy)nucleoside triphosphate pyrophosphohydrolase [Syntrophorhabdales bacterium]|nr:(deoxy)nucleoside triphosphate pyrophosphohydrolase [Syntrophorhabdales bacterium]